MMGNPEPNSQAAQAWRQAYEAPGASPNPYEVPNSYTTANPQPLQSSPQLPPQPSQHGKQWRLRDEPPLWAPWYGIGFWRAVTRCFRKTFIYHGRASRGEYWWVWLFTLVLSAVLGVAAYGIGLAIGLSGAEDSFMLSSPLDGFISNATIIAQLAMLVPTISLSIRRLHDENRRGWWLLLPTMLQVVAVFVLFVVIIAAGVAGGGSDTAIGQGLVAGMLAFFGMYLLSGLASVVLMIGPSDPRGVRFDRPDGRRHERGDRWNGGRQTAESQPNAVPARSVDAAVQPRSDAMPQ
ncbi:DUF805 domain-containing protein [Bifidobacterium sp. SO4]|uniref:DUF805 domain-containing protein n=1 Tax=Bifidobacterium sp. SO4 TaxID=2809030 RepID=UPI001BDD3BD1|nr:DUF805 domain-containing protein [Bifidobacterium sp. SO4]MBT1170537.1 DUF805 domain-containing protein [Bifidobacterium sp. SO4]